LLAVKSGFILFKDYQFSLQINTLERERELSTLTGNFFPSKMSSSDLIRKELSSETHLSL
jgi:hypothetical protein